MSEVISSVGKKHKVNIVYNESVDLSGIESVMSYDENEVVLKTSDNILSVKGEKFNIETLDLEKCEVRISGRVASIGYSKTREKVGLLKRLIK